MSRFIDRLVRTALSCIGMLLVLVALPARADEGRHVFWEVTGQHNTLYLLGSVHVLQSGNRALPAVTDSAYADAEVLVEELDVYAAASDMLTPEAQALQFLPQGQTLAALLDDPPLHEKLRAVAGSLALDMDYLNRMRPWYAATLLSSMRLMKAGYSSQDGVDFQIAERARRDGKPIVGLETATQQFGYFAALPMEEQRRFLAGSLEESDGSGDLRGLTEAWRGGDLVALEKELQQGMQESPVLFQSIVVQRNRDWLPRLEQMLGDPEKDYLVVTGALHMVGPQGLVELLRKKGYKVTRK